MPNPADDTYATAAERALASDCRDVLGYAQLLVRQSNPSLSAQLVAGRFGWRRSRALAALEALDRSGVMRRTRRRGDGHWELTGGELPSPGAIPSAPPREAAKKVVVEVDDFWTRFRPRRG